MKRESTIELTQDHLNLIHCAAKEMSRPILATLYIDEGYVIGCDGFKLARMPLGTPEDFEPYAIPVELFKRIKLPKGGMLSVKRSELDLTLTFKDGSQSELEVYGKVREGTYPDYKSLWPSGDSVGKVAFSNWVLKDLLAALPKVPKGETVIVKLFPRSISSPVVFEVTIKGSGVQIDGLLMPMKIDWEPDDN